MVTARIHAVELYVRHVRYPGDRMPVGCFYRGKGPQNIFTGYAADDMRVGGNVDIVVKIQELVVSGLPIYGNNEDNQRQAY